MTMQGALSALATRIQQGVNTLTCRALLGAHPEVQQKVAAELEAAGLRATTAKPEPRRLSYADLGRLPYLDAVRHTSAELGDGCW